MKKKTFYEKIGYLYVSISVKLNRYNLLPKLADYLLDRGSQFYIHGKKKIIESRPGLKEDWMYSWRFHFNPYTQEWNAYHVDDARAYMNGWKTEHVVIKTKTIEAMLSTLLIVHNKDHKNLYGC
jgi:hypothetical protein